ncbi:unnamed protein product [Clavelina lepadiformis]|uniref:Uncharacterized protein n=1 Tax=Clavelina lepadiformis TaxID=159417 RepID=A0ABP0G945_CLALP
MKRQREKMEWYDGWINMVEEQFEVVRITQDLIKDNIEAAELLLTRHNFIYVLPGVFVDEALEKFFGQARQRSGDDKECYNWAVQKKTISKKQKAIVFIGMHT